MSSRRVLLVDDDPNILSACNREFRGAFEFDTATNGADALSAIENHGPYAVVVSDHQMPGMSGLTLLRKIRESGLPTTRIMMTGKADRDTAIAAVNEGEIFRFLSKPCPSDMLIQSILEGIEKYQATTHLAHENHRLSVQLQQLSERFESAMLHAKAVDPQRQSLRGTVFLPALRELRDALCEAIRRRAISADPVLLLLLDIDNFRKINGTHGFQFGDRLLMEVSRHLASALPAGCSTTHVAANRFGVVCLEPPTADDLRHRMNIALQTAGAALEAGRLNLSASIGVSKYPENGTDVDTLLMHAELALDRAKRVGPGSLRVYDPAFDAEPLPAHELRNELEDAVEQRQFRLMYQPQVCASRGSLIGVEALLRWAHPKHGVVSPDVFVPLLEETGLIVPVGEWVMRTACEDAMQLEAEGLGHLRMAVNVSSVELRQDGFVETIETVLSDTGLPAERLEIEFTESAQMDPDGGALLRMVALRRLGVQLAIDDFGTGYSALSYLNRFPVHRLKVDRSFIRDLSRDSEHETITEAVIGLAHRLGMSVVVEGIETRQQFQIVRDMGCDICQGFLFGPPLASVALAEWASNRPDALEDF